MSIALPDLGTFTKCTAAKAAVRLLAQKFFSVRPYGHSRVISLVDGLINIRSFDTTVPTLTWNRHYDVSFPSWDAWLENNVILDHDEVVFTDGSKAESGCGAGVFFPNSLDRKLSSQVFYSLTGHWPLGEHGRRLGIPAELL